MGERLGACREGTDVKGSMGTGHFWNWRKQGMVRAERGSRERPGRPAGSELWGLEATVRSTWRVHDQGATEES